jgi:signal transduction histidine kinase/HPt (histidine-containing phosphotransfer) domain-containing protein
MSDEALLLLVDDHEANLLALASILEGPDIRMIKALSANEALGLMLKHDFALALIDVQMPDMNGFEMAELMRANPRTRNVPIIFVTGLMNDVHMQFQGYELGAVDYLIKPLVPHVLRNKAGIFCELFRQNRRLAIANVELREARDIAEAATRAKSDFLANMSHEIRTPLNSVIGMAHLALRSGLDERQHGYVEKIVVSGQHLLALLNDVLDFSKIEAGKLDLESADFDLVAVIANLRNLLEAKAATKYLTLDFAIDAAIPRSLRGDPLRLGQVLINLVSNGIKFTERGGLTVSAALAERVDDEAVLRFEVTDTGVGIPPERIGGLFQAFQQLDTSITRKFGGTGLGLAICRQLVEKMGGEIGVDSTPGCGSTFWFAVRLGALLGPVQPLLADRPALDATTVAALRGVRILLAEDHPFNQQIATEMLEDVGAMVCIANNGNEALDLLRRERFDCVLMDMQMPEMDGLEATRKIRADPALANQRIIAMTANASNEDRLRCLAAGMDDFMTKPILPDGLYAMVIKWVSPAGQGSTAGGGRSADATAFPAGDPQIIDLSVLAGMVKNDPKKIQRFAEKFLESTAKGIGDIEAALAAQDVTALAALGHRLKSSARSVGAMGLGGLCQQLQGIKDREDLAAAGKIVTELRPLLQRITQAVGEFNNANAAGAPTVPSQGKPL